jgi:HK97 family phage major capsid protein
MEMAEAHVTALHRHISELEREMLELDEVKLTRDPTIAESKRYLWLSNKVDGLKREIRELRDGGNRRHDTFDVYRPEGGGTVWHSRTADNLTAIEARYLRTGDPGALAELRASNDTDMNIGTPADGGYAVPVGHYQGIIAKMRPQALYAQLGVMEIPGIGTTVNVPIDNEGDDGAFVATNEVSEFDRDAPALDQVPMTLVKYTKKIEFSVELLQDEDSRLMEFINGYIADGMAATLNSLLVTEALADGTAALTLDAADTIAAAEVPELLYKLKGEYMNGNVAWLMNRLTEGHIRGKTGDAFQFAPTPSGRTGSQSELFGVKVATSSYMPQISAGNKVLLVGNWSKMGIRLAPGLEILRDPYTLGHLGQVRLLCFFRADFEVLQAEAFQYATLATG